MVQNYTKGYLKNLNVQKPIHYKNIFINDWIPILERVLSFEIREIRNSTEFLNRFRSKKILLAGFDGTVVDSRKAFFHI